MIQSKAWRRVHPALCVAALAIGLSACGASADAGSPESPAASQSATPDAVNIAVLVGGASNAYQAAGVAAIEADAADQGAEVTVLDAAFDASKQYAQLQTAISSGKYQGIIINPVDGAGIVPLVAEAEKAGVKIAAWNQPIGSDLTTADPTVPGVTSQVMFPVRNHGLVMGDLTLKACAEQKADPCNVAILYFQKGSPFDTAVFDGFKSVVEKDPSVKVIAEADTQATRQGGLAAAQTILAGHPDVNVMFGTSQSVVGALPAVKAANLDHPIALLGIALTRQGAEAVANGELYGGSQSMAGDEGRLALEQLVKALRGESFEAGINPDEYLNSPCKDAVTKENVGQCTFDFDG
jgi:ribose transport system substrate-binding protein